MKDSNWESMYATGAGRRVFPWGKVLLGCGAAAVLAMAGCGGLLYWATHSGKDTMKGYFVRMAEKPWARFVAVADAIQTDEGALGLYRANPLLVGDFPTEGDFLKRAAEWRAKVSGLPRRPPPFDELDKNDFGMFYSRNMERGANTLTMSYRIKDGERMSVCWEGELLAEFSVK